MKNDTEYDVIVGRCVRYEPPSVNLSNNQQSLGAPLDKMHQISSRFDVFCCYIYKRYSLYPYTNYAFSVN